MKKKNLLSIIMLILLIFIILSKENIMPNTIGSIAYNVNKKNNYIYIKENNTYIKYLVLTNNYNETKNTLLIREKIIGNSDYITDYNGSIYKTKIYNGTKEMENYCKYEETSADIFLQKEFPNNFDEEFLELVNITNINIPDINNYILDRKFFLLSLQELGFQDPGDESSYGSIKYFKDNGCIATNDYNIELSWWTRSVNQAQGTHISIGANGNEDSSIGDNAKCGIRPAFTLPNHAKIKKIYINDEIGTGYIVDY